MTELTLAAEQPRRFHEKEYDDPDTRGLLDEWRDVIELLPLNIEAGYGILSPGSQLRLFSAPVGAVLEADDPRIHLASSDEASTRAELLQAAYGRQVERMRDRWITGTFPRHGLVTIDGLEYDIYNHMPAFRFTGAVRTEGRLDWHTEEYEPWHVAEFDMSPLVGDDGDYIPADPELPVIVLPSMGHERFVSRELVVAHLRALHDSMAPHIVAQYAGGLPDLLASEEACLVAREPQVEPQSRPRLTRLRRMATMAMSHIF
jgi:hypothetical protein